MSWQSYVDTNLIGSGRVTQAAILGLAGGVWATSAGFNITPEEQKAIVDGFNNPAQVQASGLRIAGEKYFTLQATPQNIYLKKAADGGVVVKTTQAVLVAIYKAPIQQSETTVVVEGLGDYLRSVNY
ncbi:profilin, required for normal timing of actin polymerization in response to thermal stress [Paramarasmius palmivorus]|uniref:Profilin n=1 Tax=Paramarasmius palmivorus TaxID=297713 RepID=A0AAW0DXX5_9AGAR